MKASSGEAIDLQNNADLTGQRDGFLLGALLDALLAGLLSAADWPTTLRPQASSNTVAAPFAFKAATIRPADAKSINGEGEAEVLGGKQVDIALVPKAGTYHLQCNKPGHVALGMKGTIVVK